MEKSIFFVRLSEAFYHYTETIFFWCIFPSFFSMSFAFISLKDAVNLLTEAVSLPKLTNVSPVCYPVTTLMTNNQGEIFNEF